MKDGKIDRRTRGTAGGDRIDYPGAIASKSASMELFKCIVNSAVSDDATLTTMDIKDFYLNTTLTRPEFLKIHRKQISDAIMDKYNLHQFQVGDYVHVRVDKGMYGLKQAGLLSHERLVKHLASHDYIENPLVPCLFHHAKDDITFCLVVDDFLIKSFNAPARQRLYTVMKKIFEITIDENESMIKFLNITIRFDRPNQRFILSMPGYISKMLKRFERWAGTKHARSPGIYTHTVYSSNVQLAPTPDISDSLSAIDTTFLMEFVGVMKYYVRALDLTGMHDVHHLGSLQSKPTESLIPVVRRICEYFRTYPDSEVVYRKSKMEVCTQTDASYNSRSEARSVAGCIIYFGDASDPTVENGAILGASAIIDAVMASAGESEIAGAFIAAQHTINIRTIAIALQHPQPPSPILTDNEFTVDFANNTCKQRRSKTIDMRFYWLRDRVKQNQIVITHIPGKNNLADIFTKTLSVQNFQPLIPRLVQPPPNCKSFGFRVPYVRQKPTQKGCVGNI